MTLVVGIKCTDGVVIASDSAMTFYSGLVQNYSSKVQTIDNDFIVACTGEIGLSQRFIEVVNRISGMGDFAKLSPLEIGKFITASTINDFNETNVPLDSFAALVAFPFMGRTELLEIQQNNLQPEFKDRANWYTALGSGYEVALPLLGFVRNIFWGDCPPNRQEGIFAAVLVLELAFSMHPYGVAGPIQMATLTQEDNPIKATLLTKEELEEHRVVAENAMEHFRSFSQSPDSTVSIPEPES
ncbi:MAG: hypothetical protein OXC80_09960 [Gammaproteobacteria bacterium]|nr:hypothetical protein [Gammaproteobacteria bacterium]